MANGFMDMTGKRDVPQVKHHLPKQDGGPENLMGEDI